METLLKEMGAKYMTAHQEERPLECSHQKGIGPEAQCS